MSKFGVTFGQKYNYDEHPSGLPIDGNSFLVIEAYDEIEAREKIYDVVGTAYSFLYEWTEFEPQIEKYGLKEVKVDE